MYLMWKSFFLLLCAAVVSGCLFGGGETEGRGGSETEGLHGKMIFEDGNPAEGAVVTAKLSEDSSSLGKKSPPDSAVDTTDARGRYSFTTLNPGSYSIKGAWWKNNAKDTLKALRDKVPYDGNDTNVGTDTLLPPGRINLSIVHEPVEGVDCYITGVTAAYKSDPQGQCEVVNLIPGTYTLSYGRQGYLTQTVRVKVVSGETTTLTAKRLWADPSNAPPAPQNVKAQYHRETGTALVEWDSVYVKDLLGYRIYRNVNGGGYKLLEEVTDTSHLDSIYPLMLDTNRKVIQYRIRSLDTDGNASINSSTVEIEATPPNKPGDPRPVNEDPSVGLTPVLQWSEVLPIGGELPYYQILLGTHRDSLAILVSDLETETFALDSLLPNKTYYWQIITTVGDSVVIGPVWTFHTRVNQPPSVPQLLSPSQNEVVNDSSVNLQWSATDPDKEDTLSYRVLFGKDSSNLEVLVKKTSDTAVSVNALDSGSAYYWRVIAYDLHDSSTSDLGSFSAYRAPEQLELLYPAADETGVPRQLELRWRAEAGSFDNMYFIYFGEDSSSLELLDSTGDTSVTVSNLTQGTPYWWRIVMDDGASRVSSETQSFTTNYLPRIAVPVYPFPGDKVKDTIVTLSWSGSDPDGDSLIYRIFMGPDTNDFTFSTMGDTFTFTPAYPPGDTIYWRVYSLTEANGDTAKGDLWWFVINAAPVIDSLIPTKGDTLGTSAATLQWSAGDANGDSLTYKILWGSDSSSLTPLDTVLAQNEVDLTNLQRETFYYWRLMVYDDMDSTASPLQYFYTKQNTPPEFLSDFHPGPDSVLSGFTAELGWTAQDSDGDPLSFRLLGGTDSNNLNLVDLPLDTAGFQWNDLQKTTTYYWRVVAYDGFDSTYSKLLAFQSKGNTAPTLPNLAFPAPDTVVTDSNFSFSWSGGDPDPEDNLRYTLLFGEDSSSLSPLAQDIQDSSAASGPLSNFKTYYWRVIAYDGYDSVSSPVSWFRVDYPALVAHWDFNEGSGNVLGDKSGNGNDGEIIGAEWMEQDMNNILDFDGLGNFSSSSQCIRLGNTCWMPNNFTLEAWVTIDQILPSQWPTSKIIVLANSDGGISLGINQNKITGTIANSNSQQFTTEYDFSTGVGRFTHIVLTANLSTSYAYLYVNGIRRDSIELQNPTFSRIDSILLGKDLSSSTFYNGAFLDFKVYNYNLRDSLIFANYSSQLPTDPDDTPSLIAHWDFNDGNGNTLTDKSGNENHGSIQNGATWIQGIEGSALQFNGVDQYVAIEKYEDFRLDRFTISAWVKPKDFSLNEHAIFSTLHLSGDHTNQKQGYTLKFQNGGQMTGMLARTDGLEMRGGANKLVFDVFPTSLDASFHHVALTFDGNTLVYYLNGTEINTISYTGRIDNQVTTPTIGAELGNDFADGYLNGILDEIKIYNHALSSDSIESEYLSTNPFLPSEELILHWEIDEGAGNVLSDLSGNNNSGNVTNASWTNYDVVDVLDFNGRNSSAATSSCLNLSASCWKAYQFSIETWIAVDQILPSGLPNARLLELGSGNGKISLDISLNQITGTTTHLDATATTLKAPFENHVSQLVHLVFTRDAISGENRLYLNGSLIDAQVNENPTSFDNQSQNPLIVGRKSANTTFFNGLIKSIKIYNYPLNSSQIQINYTNDLIPDPNATPRLIAHWDFNDGSGTQLSDISGNGNHGTLQGGTWTADAIEGTALEFNGTGDHVLISNYADFRVQKYTIMAWINPNSITHRAIFSVLHDSDIFTGKQGYILKFQSGLLSNILARNDGKEVQSQTDKWIFNQTDLNIDNTKYYFVAVTFNGVQLKTYFEGVEVSSVNYTGGIDMPFVEPTIGSSMEEEFAGPIYFDGNIDQMKVYNYAISSDSISAHYNALKP